MKYTRYNIKRRTNKKFIILGLAIIALILIVVGISSENNIKKVKDKKKSSGANEVNFIKDKEIKTEKFYALQCGAFLSKENADTLVKTLKPYGNAFIVKKEESFKVIIGIYNEEEVNKIIGVLKSKGIINNKITYEIVEEDLCNVEIVALIKANLDALNSFLDKKVKAVETDKLKQWSSSLKAVDEKSKNIQVLKELKTYVSKLPKEIKIENVSEGYNLIYKCMNSIK